MDSPSSVLSSHQSADISDHTKMHKHNKKIIHFNSTVSFDFCIRSNKIIILLFLFQVLPLFSLTSATVTLHCRSCSTTEDLQQRHRNQDKKSAVITLFEMTIIKITYNLRFKICLIHFIGVYSLRAFDGSFLSVTLQDKHTCVSCPVTSDKIQSPQ